MNMKKYTTLLVILIIILLSVLTYFGVLKQNKQVEEIQEVDRTLREEANTPKETVTVKHQYQDKDQKHIFVGSIDLPNPCYRLKTSHNKKENKEVELNFEIEEPEGDQACIAVISPTPFRLLIEGEEDLFFTANLNNKVANLNQFEISSDQNIDEVEIFIKG